MDTSQPIDRYNEEFELARWTNEGGADPNVWFAAQAERQEATNNAVEAKLAPETRHLRSAAG
jgi:hypothetical protein